MANWISLANYTIIPPVMGHPKYSPTDNLLEDFDMLANAWVLLTKIIGVKFRREECDGV